MTEFKNNLRKAFNQAETGTAVEIERFGEKYLLVKQPRLEKASDHNRMNVPYTGTLPGEVINLPTPLPKTAKSPAKQPLQVKGKELPPDSGGVKYTRPIPTA